MEKILRARTDTAITNAGQRIRTHTRIRDAVVRGENRDYAPARRCGRVVADGGVAPHDLLEIAEAPMRLRQRIEPRGRGPCRLSVERFDSRQRFLEQAHAGSSVKMDRQIAELCIAVASASPSSSDLPSHESK